MPLWDGEALEYECITTVALEFLIHTNLRESDALVVVPSPLLVRLWHRQSHADQAREKN